MLFRSPAVMKKVAYEITGKDYLPYFTETVLFSSDLLSSLSELHHMIMHEEKDFKKEEILLLIIEQLIAEYDHAGAALTTQPPNTEIKAVCDFLENNYMKSITLNDLSDLTGISKYYLLCSFTKQKGISPYCYLETIRIGNAKKLLEQQIAPIDVALQTGFTDQSHFTNFFKKLIGLTPKQYMNIFTEGSRRSGNE